MTFLAFTGLINFICSATLAAVVYRKCPRRDVGIAYSILNLTIATFSAFYFFWQCSSTPEWGLFNLRMLTVSAMWINQGLLYFNIVFFGKTVLRQRVFWLAALANVVFSVLNFTPIMYSAVVPRYNLGFWPSWVNGWFVFYVAWWHTELLYAFGDLLYSRRFLEGHRRNQVTYMITAFAIGYAGGITNWPMWFGIHLPPYPNFLISVYTLIVGYAMVRHHLMDINVVIRKTLVYSLLSAALAAVYVGTITLLAHVLGGHHGSASAFSSALAAIVITLLFNPVRIRIQRFVDRHFYREAVDQTVLREITGAFVHEIKTPISNIALPAELTFKDMEDLQKGRQSAEDLIPKIKKRMKYIMDQALLAGAKVEAVREATVADAIAQGRLDLRQVLESSLKQMQDRLRHPSVKVRIDIPTSLSPIPGSARQLEIVFANLIKNAAEAMEELPENKPHEIHIQATTKDGRVVILVSDTGPGIKPEDTERIFQSHYTTKGSQGAGMGLSLVKQIILAHAGSIEVISNNGAGATPPPAGQRPSGPDVAGGGATFQIRLPTAP